MWAIVWPFIVMVFTKVLESVLVQVAYTYLLKLLAKIPWFKKKAKAKIRTRDTSPDKNEVA